MLFDTALNMFHESIFIFSCWLNLFISLYHRSFWSGYFCSIQSWWQVEIWILFTWKKDDVWIGLAKKNHKTKQTQSRACLCYHCYTAELHICSFIYRYLASGSGDTTVRFWDVNTETPHFTCKGRKQIEDFTFIKDS